MSYEVPNRLKTQAVNKAFDVFAEALKTSTPETLSMAEALGKAEADRKLETLLLKKENPIAEAHALLDPKIEKIILAKKNEFAQLKKEKDALKATEKFAQEFRTKIQKEMILEKKNEFAQMKKEKDALKAAEFEKFAQEFRTRIHKISTLKEALHWERNSILEKYGSFTMLSTTIHSIKEALSTKIITLKSQFIETRLNELNNELRVYLLTTNFGNVPEEDQIKVHIKKIIQSFKKECFENAIESAEFCIIEGKIQTTLEKTGLICRNILASKKITEIKKAELEAELAAEIQKSDSANYSNIASDSENDLEEEHGICKTQSNGSLNMLDTFKEEKKKESAETSLELMESHRTPPCCKPISQPSQEVKLAHEGNIVDDSGIEKTRQRFEGDQKETTYANEDRVVSRSASLPTNLPRPDSPEYDEISDTEIDRYVSKTLVDDAVREMDIKFRVLKTILEQIDGKNEKQRHFEEIYQEYAAWCEARIDSKIMIYFVHKFHTECTLYMREHHGIDIDVRGYENEIIRRTENPKWTDAQNLKRKVLQRRKSKPAKKKVCAQKVGDVFNELLAQEFHNVLECDSLSIAKISALIEYSKSKRDFFSRTLCKYDKHEELSKLLDKGLVDNWIFFFYCLPRKGFGEWDTLNEYERVRKDLPLNVPHGTHLILLSDIKELFNIRKNKREREERERRENEGKQRQAETFRRLEDGNKSREISSFPKVPIIRNSANSYGTTSQYRKHPQAINYHQSGSRSSQRTDSDQEIEKFEKRAEEMQDFHH